MTVAPIRGALAAAVVAASITASYAFITTTSTPWYIQDVNPRNLSSYLGTPKNVFLTLFSPTLPKWSNFSLLLNDLYDMVEQPGTNTLFVKGNCKEYPGFVKKFGIRMFPALFYFPAFTTAGTYLPIAFSVNRTREDYYRELSALSTLTQPVTQDLNNLHHHVAAFMDLQDKVDREIAWATGAERRELKRMQLLEMRRRMYGEPIPSPTPTPTPAEPTPTESAAEVSADGTAAAVVEATPEPTATPTEQELAAQREAEDLAHVAPLIERARDSLYLLRLRQSKVEFYISVLEKLAKHGNGVIAQMSSKRQAELVRDGSFMDAGTREQLVMEIAVLEPFVQQLL